MQLMTIPLVATKLHLPRPRRDLIHRQRLDDLLEQGAQSRLTLISAPAGFGKTTMLVDWLGRHPSPTRAVAWVSLEPSENEVAAFWAYLVAAVRGAAAALGGDLPAFPDDEVPTRSTTVGLLNALVALDGELVVVLDDLHVIEDRALLNELAFFIEHLPDNVRLVISTRADPLLPLAGLRARGELAEIRSGELRFHPEEVASYFASAASPLKLGPRDIDRLEQRTEGWVAALQLAALSMRGRSDISAFVADFAGSDRYVVDYLVEEVLRDQPDSVRQFLYATAMLPRFTTELCDAVLGTGGSAAAIEILDQQNLFVVALDDRRQWYRYHHLFADVLQAHMPEAERSLLAQRHRRASLWFEDSGNRDDAIRHALAAVDFELAADLVELAIPQMRQRRRVAVLRTAIEALPDALVRSRPALSINLVGTLLTEGVTEGIEERLAEAETVLRNASDAASRTLAGAIEVYRSALAQMRGDIPSATEHAHRVYELAPKDAYLERAGAAGFLAIVAWSQGRLDDAQRHWADCTDGLLKVGYISDALSTIYARGQIALAQGNLTDAETVLKRGLAIGVERGASLLPGLADLHIGLAEVDLARNDLEGAETHLAESESADFSGTPQYPSRKLAVAASLAGARADIEEALALLDDAARLFVADFFPNARPIAAMRARLSMAQGDWPAVERWQRDSNVTADLPLSYVREYEHITLARFYLARKDHSAALALLERLLPAAEGAGRKSALTEINVLRALAFHALGDGPAAQSAVRSALDSADSSGDVRVLVEARDVLAGLLREAARGRSGSALARKLLAAPAGTRPSRSTNHPDLLEALSERELDVLRLLRGELSGPDIASELRVSLNTVRTHTKNIYEKLGVNTRRAAVRRAEEMNLIRRERPAQ